MSDLLYCVTTPTLQSDVSNLVALSDLLLDLGVNDTESPFYKRALAKASQAARTYCNRSFIVRTYTTNISCDKRPGARQFWNRRECIELNAPLIQVASVTENETLLVAGTDYSVDVEDSRIYRLNSAGDPRRWSSGPIVVVYSAGFAQTPSEAHVVPVTAPYTIRVTDTASFAVDLGVTYANGAAFSAVGSPAADGQYSVNANGIYTFYSGDAGASIITNYAYNSIPLDVQEAVTRLVKTFKDQRGRDPALKRESNPGQGDKEYWIPSTPMGFLTPDIRELLDQYRVPSLA